MPAESTDAEGTMRDDRSEEPYERRGGVARLLAAAAWGALLFPNVLAAQEQLDPGETRVQRGAPPTETEQTETEQTDEGSDGREEDEPPPRPGVEEFEEKTRKRVRPDELPPPSTGETDLPDVLRSDDGRLPEPPNMEDLQETGDRVGARVFELVSIQQPEAPGDATPIVHRGHAVVVGGGDRGPPVLITTYFWLEDAERLYLVPQSLSSGGDDTDDSKPTAERRSFEEMTVDGKANAWLDAHRDELVRARLFKPDRHRNLTTVVPDDPGALGMPDRGLKLFESEESSPTRLYGYSPRTGGGLEQTKLLDSHPDAEALVYYLQTPYSAVFGAPIVSSKGELLVLTAFQHPNRNSTVLAVPPAPIAAYLDDVLATLE